MPGLCGSCDSLDPTHSDESSAYPDAQARTISLLAQWLPKHSDRDEKIVNPTQNRGCRSVKGIRCLQNKNRGLAPVRALSVSTASCVANRLHCALQAAQRLYQITIFENGGRFWLHVSQRRRYFCGSVTDRSNSAVLNWRSSSRLSPLQMMAILIKSSRSSRRL